MDGFGPDSGPATQVVIPRAADRWVVLKFVAGAVLAYGLARVGLWRSGAPWVAEATWAWLVCLAPGVALLPVMSRLVALRQPIPILACMVLRLVGVATVGWVVAAERARLGVAPFLLWVVVFYLVLLAWETFLLLRPQ